ncbi:MAG: glycosyltransferase family 4 protein [Rhodospirillaceae bacterium]|nr:glycosyltransferase family 4 protein [Rhodospirillaceae bacterium]
MKILLTVHQFFPNYFSGTEVLTYSVAKEFLRRGHAVAVLTGFPAQQQLDDADRFDEYDLEGIRVFRFHHAYVPMGGQNVVTEIEYDNHLSAKYFARILETFKPDIIHFFHMSRLGVGMIDAVVSAEIPAYFTPTDFWSICPTAQLLLHGGKVCPGPTPYAGNCVKHVAELTRGPKVGAVARRVPDMLADLIVRLTANGVLPRHALSGEITAMRRRKSTLVARLNWLQGIVSPTKLMTRVLTENGVDTRLIMNARYGIDVAGYDTSLSEVKPGARLVIGFIGTLAPHKGPHILIEAFKGLPPGAAELKIYGNPADFPDYYAGLQRRAEGIAGITFCGTFPNGEIGKVISGINVLIVPSLWYENTPLVVYSSLAARRPVIASDFPGLSETITHDANGLMFPPGDFMALRARLRRLIDEPALLGTLSGNCRPPKSSATYVDELLGLYRNGLPDAPKARDLSALRRFAPLGSMDNRGALSGWAVAGLNNPARISLRTGAEIHGETRRFMPRPDVRDALRKGGVNVKANAFGFVIKLPDGLDRAQAVLHCEAADGRVFTVPLRDLAVGAAHHTGGGDYMAIDSERLMWQAGSP